MERVRIAIADQVKLLNDNHQNQLRELQSYLESSMSIRYNPSNQLLNLRKIQLTLSKQMKYKEAETVQK